MAVTKSLRTLLKKAVDGNYLENVCVLILCNLRCSAQQFSLSLALAGPYRVVGITWKQGMECTALIPFLHLITYYFRMLSAPWLQNCLQKLGSRTPLRSTLSPREKGLAEQLFILLTCTSHQHICLPAQTLNAGEAHPGYYHFVYNTKAVCTCSSLHFISHRQHQAAFIACSCF